MGGKVFTELESAFLPFAHLPPIRRASLAVALNPSAPDDVLLGRRVAGRRRPHSARAANGAFTTAPGTRSCSA